jgi:hypothetical protein
LDLDDFDFMSSLLVDEFSLETFGLWNYSLRHNTSCCAS